MKDQKELKPKIFGIGLSHTGTRSLNNALNILGIKAIHWPLDYRTYSELRVGMYNLSLLEEYQAITDITVAPFYAQLDRTFPGSKFILTLRNRESWHRSMKRINQEDWITASKKCTLSKSWQLLLKEVHNTSGFRKILRILQYILLLKGELRRVTAIEFQRLTSYGALAFKDEERLLYAYDIHRRNVFEYFKERPEDLLIIDICSGDGWPSLCKFLSRPVPNSPFPYVKHGRR